MIDITGYVTVAEAAERLHLTPEQVRRRLRCGQLRGERVGAQWFVERSAMLQTIKAGPLIAPEVIEDVRRLRRHIKEDNGGRDLDIVEMLRESRAPR